MDFAQEPDVFVNYLSKIGRDYNHAKSNFLGYIDHWKLLAERNYGHLVIIEHLPDERGYSGTILGKPFAIEITPIAVEAEGRVEAIVTVPHLGGGKTEIGRFRINRDGALADGDAQNGGSHDDYMSVKIFMGVLKQVLEFSVRAGHSS
ncbi:hypothetical protein [Pseudomonas sp. TNT3]|uniref:hypothetical protein n=1 Tax=Pseudomonas sp. TNT3 TaxID=2654097 RepID=UPI001390B4D0|nr:hypothetical protein [Pseudomonas sp. TNT3]KAI2693243.1 hypothetical protein GBC55_006860 [Pseudomonas sp. TNT3]